MTSQRAALLQSVCVSNLFSKPPTVEFRSEQTHCPSCGTQLIVRKTRTRTVSTLHLGPFQAREVVLFCKACAHPQRSEELAALVPPGANFGYDVLVHAGEALFLRHRNEAEVVAEFAQKNVRISPWEVSLLGMKFVAYLALAHQRRAPALQADMQTRGGYICHLDATCEGGNPFLMSSIDSLSNIVLGNVKLPAEDEALALAPVVGTYTLIQWALNAKNEGDGYGFPFDHPHLAFAQRLQLLSADIQRIKNIHLRGQWRDNRPYFKLNLALQPLMNDKILWKAVKTLEAKITVFEKLRKAMRIAAPVGPKGLNDEGGGGTIRTIEKRVTAFRSWLTHRKDYPQDRAAQKMIEQIDRYWKKLFADPITVQTPSGPIQVQPQRTNNLLEQFFRSLKRAHRRRTGNAASGRMLRTILAETPLVRNLQNSHYMTLLLDGRNSLEEVFAEIEIGSLRQAFREARIDPERIPAKLKPIIAMPNFSEIFVHMVKKEIA